MRMKSWNVNFCLVMLVIVVIFSSCKSSKGLYNWGKGDDTSEFDGNLYRFYSKSDTLSLVCTYAYMLSYPEGERKIVPPGTYLGMAYLYPYLMAVDDEKISSIFSKK